MTGERRTYVNMFSFNDVLSWWQYSVASCVIQMIKYASLCLLSVNVRHHLFVPLFSAHEIVNHFIVVEWSLSDQRSRAVCGMPSRCGSYTKMQKWSPRLECHAIFRYSSVYEPHDESSCASWTEVWNAHCPLPCFSTVRAMCQVVSDWCSLS